MEKVEAILCDNDRGIILTHGDKERVHQAYIELSTVYEMNHLPNNLQMIEVEEWLKCYYQDSEQFRQLTEIMIQLAYEYNGFFMEFKRLVDNRASYSHIYKLIYYYKKNWLQTQNMVEC